MFLYQCQLAWRSIRKNPVLCGLMILALACGIAATMVCYAQYYGMSKNTLAHKDNNLFMLQTDSWHAKEAYPGRQTNQMPDTLSYRDVTALMQSDIPMRKTAMVQWGGTASIPDSETKPIIEAARVTSRDYFAMFEETFLYGNVWSKEADDHLQNLVVLSETANQRLFQGQNSVGKTILFERNLYQIVGVTKQKLGAQNRMQDIDTATLRPESAFLFPFGLLAEREVTPWRQLECPTDLHDYGTGYQAQLKGSCLWLTYWVEFSETNHKQDYEQFITRYIEDQKTQGFYPRPLRFELSNATQKLAINGITGGFMGLLVKIGIGFLVVCTLNCIAMLLAKFMRHAPECGVRRALGANRLAIFTQHLIESIFIGILGGLLGLLLTYIGLQLLRYGFTSTPSSNGMSQGNFDSVFALDIHLLLITFMVAICASLCAGIYPAWRICRTPAAQALKLQ